MNADPRQWLSTGAEVLAATPQSEGGWDCDVLIVGSGYGGAVAGAAMAGAVVAGATRDDDRPARVWILERGLERAPGRFPGRFRDLAGEVRFALQDGRAARGNAEGLFDVRIGADMSVLLGNGLGGGSLINSGVMEKPQDSVFASGWPAGMTVATLAGFFDVARTALGAQSLPASISLGKLSLLDQLGPTPGKPAERCPVTVNFGPAMRTPDGAVVKKCTLCGDCLTGCNVGAKRSLDTSYLVQARVHGAEIFCGGFAERLEPLEQGGEKGWQVIWHLTDPAERGCERPLRARRVVLAAGALGSTEILLRSKAATPTLAFSARLGQGFSGNGDAIIAARGHAQPVHAVDVESSDPRIPGRDVGPTITGLQRFPATAGHPAFVLEDFAVPAPLRSVFGEITALLECVAGADKPSTPTGGDPFAVTDFSIERTSLFGQITEDAIEGALQLDVPDGPAALEGGIRIVSPDWKGDPAAGQAFAAVHFEQDAVGLVPTFVQQLQRLPVCTHPLGGCRMADDADHGVVNDFGEVFLDGIPASEHSGLAVLDGSILPKALGINPALTISALAARAAPQLMTAWGLRPRAEGNKSPLSSERPFVPLLTGPRSPTTWRIRERQTGVAALPQWSGQTIALDIEFEPIESFRRLLSGPPPLKVAVRHAELLVGSDGRMRHVLAGTVTFFVRPQKAIEDGKATAAFTIDYDLTVKAGPPPSTRGLAVGTKVRGTKYFNPNDLPGLWTPDLPDVLAHHRSPWRELSEIELAIDGVSAGRLALDLGDLVDRGEALLRAESLPSMPDFLDDLGAIGLYFTRYLTGWLTTRVMNYKGLGEPAGLSDPVALAESRKPGLIDGIAPVRETLAHGAEISIYAPPGPKTGDCPVLLIHGLAMSGNSFTHPALGGGLAAALLKEGREVWVLDLRSSIANEGRRANKAAADWTVEAIAHDIPHAIAHMARQRETPGGPKLRIDVVAHCFGGVMFCVAALANGHRMARHVRSVVLSQVGPLVDLSPLNRLRGFLAAYIWRHGEIDEFDCVPSGSAFSLLVDAVCASFPYLDNDEDCDAAHWDAFPDLVRHRADMIFGQMYESAHVSPEVRAVLTDLLGWVKAPLVVQALQFAREELLTDASGRNKLLRRRNFSDGFAFPVLILHGAVNRVFDVLGGKRSVQLLHELRGLPDPLASPFFDGRATWYGRGTSARLAILDGYGHLDPLIGTDAAADIFPLVTDFFRESDARDAGHEDARPAVPDSPAMTLDPQIEAPWIGPMLGILRDVAVPRGAAGDGGRARIDVRLLIYASMRRAAVETIAIVPIQDGAGRARPLFDRAIQLKPSRATRRLLSLSIDAQALRAEGIWRFAVVTVHRDLPLPTGLPPDQRRWLAGQLNTRVETLDDLDNSLRGELPTDAQRQGTRWLVDRGARLRHRDDSRGLAAWASTRRALEQWFRDRGPGGWSQACFALTPGAVAGRRRAWSARFEKPLSFALASCQYPPGPLDEHPATASYQALLGRAQASDGPQFVVLAGDQVYVDATAGVFDPAAATEQQDALEVAAQKVDLSGIYERAWRLPQVRRVMAMLPSLAMIDDHEIRDNYPGLPDPSSPAGPDVLANADLSAAAQHQVKLSGGFRLGSPGSRSFAWNSGGLPFFMLETRLSRERRSPGTVGTAAMLPKDVLADVLHRLARLPAHVPKFILSSTPLLPPERFPADPATQPMRLRSDSWSGFPASAIALMEGILASEIRGVVLLAGDPHQSSVTSFIFDDDPTIEVVSVVSSGLYTPWPFANQRPDEVVLDGPARIGGTGPAGRMHRHQHTSEAAFAEMEVTPATPCRAAGLRVVLHQCSDRAPLVAALSIGLPMRETLPPATEGAIMPTEPTEPIEPIDPASEGGSRAAAIADTALVPEAAREEIATRLAEAAPAIEGGAAPGGAPAAQLQASITLWVLTASAEEPTNGRNATATLQPAAAGSWRIDAASFQTDPVTVSNPPAEARITLRQDAVVSVKGPRVDISLDVKVSIATIVAGARIPVPPSSVQLALSNAADVGVTKPRVGAAPKQVDLKVQAYDPATGAFAVAGTGNMTGTLFAGPVALLIEGRFVPPL